MKERLGISKPFKMYKIQDTFKKSVNKLGNDIGFFFGFFVILNRFFDNKSEVLCLDGHIVLNSLKMSLTILNATFSVIFKLSGWALVCMLHV